MTLLLFLKRTPAIGDQSERKEDDPLFSHPFGKPRESRHVPQNFLRFQPEIGPSQCSEKKKIRGRRESI